MRSGVALIMTLWVLVLLSVVVMNFSFSTRWGSASTRNFKDETKAYYLAMSAYQEALGYLLSDKDTVVDFVTEDGTFYLDKETKPVTGKRVTDEAEIEIKLSDEGSKININNSINEESRGDVNLQGYVPGYIRLKTLLDYIGIPDSSEQEVIDSILDWKDTDNDHHLSGAEDDYYEDLDPPYKAKNNNLDTVEELLLVRGFKQEYLYGSDEVKPLHDLITTVGDGSININTASKEIMAIAGVSDGDIEYIVKQRTTEFGGLRVISFSTDVPLRGIFRTASSNFRIEVTAVMNGSNQAVKIISVIKRIQTAKGFSLQPLYWRESFESRRG